MLFASSIPAGAATAGPDPSFGVAGVAAPPLPVDAADSKAGIIDLAAAADGGAYAALTGFGRPAYFGLVRLDESGRPDPSFGTGGYAAPFEVPATAPASSGSEGSGPEANGVAVQPDGKVIVAGASVVRAYAAESGNTLEFFEPLLVRYLPDGPLDPSFGAGGSFVGENLGGGVFSDVAVTPEGRILAVSRAAVYAFRPDGSPDPTFGRRGRAGVGSRLETTDPRAISLLPDGRFLVAGYRNSRRILLARLLPGGGMDRSFGGGDGVATVDVPSRRCCGRAALAVGADGGGVVVANAGAPDPRVFVAGFDPSGRRDRAFGGDGLVALPGGSVYVTGWVEAERRAAGTFTYAVARLGPDGALDRDFGKGGVETVERGEQSIAAAALTLPGGEVLVGGSYNARSPSGPAHRTTLLLTRYSPAG